MNPFFEITKRNLIQKQKDDEHYGNNNIRRFCEKKMYSDKVIDHCHIASNYRGP